MRPLEIQRKNRIESVTESLKEAKKEHRDVNFGELTILIMSEYGISRRVAKEYISVAKVKAKFK